ncbi:MAG TPA: response regulator transcription factor, partial [Bacillales bacterium]|nr:response regulator transcription factor [Bacillales bacterium]
FHLKKAGFDCIAATEGHEALNLAVEEKPGLILLDLMLPGMDGLEICRKLREKKINIPIMMLTARDEEFDKVLGLELGADDYITKPFSPREVIARVKAVLRRTVRSEEAVDSEDERFILGDLEVYPDQYEAYFKKKEMELTPKEFELLVYLLRHRGRALSREQLLNAVWHYDFVGDTRIVDVHIGHLREKIEENTKKPQYIKTIRGLGYKMEDIH